jgi:hypothetical protein
MKLGSGAARGRIPSEFRLGEEVLMMCMVPSEVAITATTFEFAAI